MIIAGKYEVISELGQGGMGTVYQVRHLELGASFALKILHPQGIYETESVGRFYHEARIMARLRHPNIVKVFDIGQDGDGYYFVMEYVQGRNLHQILKQEGLLPLAQVLAISQQIGQALAYAHNQHPPVIHRDIKPHNTLIEDETGRVVVMDFGIAKLLGSQQTQYTGAGLFIGTLAYGAPEQLRSDVTIDHRADIFSLGLVMYEMIAGHRFFAGLTKEEIIGKQLYDPKDYLPSFDRPVPLPLCKAVAKAMAKDRDRRYTNVAELVAVLARIEDCRGGAGIHLPRWLLMLSGGAVLAGLVAFLIADHILPWPKLAEFMDGMVEWIHLVDSVPAIKPSPLTASTPVVSDKATPPTSSEEVAKPASPLASAVTPATPATPAMTPTITATPPQPVEPAIPAAAVSATLPVEPLPPPVTAAELPVSATQAAQAVETVNVASVHPPTDDPVRAVLQATPSARQIAIKVCETQNFEVSGPEQGYAWWVGGQRQSEASARFRFSTSQPGRRELRVAALSDETAQLVWEILIAPVPPSEAEVHLWLAEYQLALEFEDLGRLQALGYVHSNRQLAALREKLEARQDYQVQVQNWQAETQQNGEVRVSFEQADRWRDETTRSLVVDYSKQSVTLIRQDCTKIVAR